MSTDTQHRAFAAARVTGVTVTLDEQAANKAFADYDGYPLQRALSLVDQGKFATARESVREWGTWLGRESSLLRLSFIVAKVLTWIKNVTRKNSIGDL